MRVLICALAALLLVGGGVLLLFILRNNETPNVKVSSPTLRQTANGPVEGIEEKTVLGQTYYAFRGIPYAAPPITGVDPFTGERVDRRFKAPEPLNYNWTEPLKVHKIKYLCQVTENLAGNFKKYNYSEDCLVLNVFVPSGGAEKKTVLVYVHGAGIDGGTVTDILLGPDFLLSQDNILVHLEYRVQMYGFLNLGFGDYTGNMGLKDQQLGMKWVYENIENFSGNKDEIMIYGGSQGGVFIHAHTLNKKSRKYFTRAFTSSGAISFWNLPTESNVRKIHDCLGINKTGNSLVEYMRIASDSVLKKCNETFWFPSIESPSATNAFITKTPKEIYTSDKPPVLDILFATASWEAVQMYPTVFTEVTQPWLETEKMKLPHEGFNATAYPKEYKQSLDILRKAYFENATDIDTIRQANFAYLSDSVIRDNMLQIVMLQANANSNSADEKQHRNTFFLKYSTHSDLNLMVTKEKKNYTGAGHSDDLCYYFYCRFPSIIGVYKKHLESKDEEYEMMMRWVKMITNFARYGDPSIEGDTPFKSCKSSDEIYCQDVSNDPKTRVMTDIKEQFHYNTWRQIENIYKSLKRPSHW